ncbi:ABC transporter permease subunit [Metamycoplasma equirhinis]|uniref:ABC transporter permease subunit n=1 Tax=Metamycoplasma equirhinis TaxID=92402 RepID=A0ABZ0PB01_9BACT|nr:ABC transporter permease subunit [Metamycoplasma equirhinis]TPD98265.1 ABC transporter permease subunit [Metamycoplasma equirhinis]WPB54103.1 ABC transporter permease subunit [Metamycoplasma equirhinis]
MQKNSQSPSSKVLNESRFEKLINFFQPKFTDINNQKVVKKFPWDKILASLLIIVLFIGFFTLIKPDFQNWKIFWKSIAKFFEINKVIEIGISKFTPLDTFKRSLQFLWTTVSYSVLGTILGMVVSVPLALLSSKNFIKNKFIFIPFRIIMSIIRAVPPVVFAFIFSFLFSNSLAATFSIAVFVCSLMTKWLYEDLDTYDISAYQGMQAIGNGKILAFKKSIFPYLSKRIVSYGFYSFEMVVRFAAILSIVGIPTIGQLLSDNYASIDKFSHISIVLWTLISLMILIELLNYVIKKYILEFTPKHPNIDAKLPFSEQVNQLKRQKSKIYIFKIIIAIFIAIIFIATLLQIEWKLGNSVKIIQFETGMQKLFNPDWSLFREFSGSKTNPIPLGFEALLIALASSIIGFIFAFAIGIFAAKNISGYFSYIFKFVIIVLRAIPAFTFALLFLILSKESRMFAGVLALGIHSIGMLGKLIMESVEKIPRKIFQSLDSIGATWFQKVKFGVVKAILPQALSNLLYRIEINFKSTVVIGAVGASEFGFQVFTYSGNSMEWDKLSSYLIFTIVVLLILEQISNILRSKIMTGYFFTQDVWFKRMIREKMYIKALAICNSNDDIFLNETRYVKYVLAKHKFDKLPLLSLNNLPLLSSISDAQLIDLKNNVRNKENLIKKNMKLISQNLKKLKSDVCRETLANASTQIKKWQIFKRNKIVRKSIKYAVEKYFESFVRIY